MTATQDTYGRGLYLSVLAFVSALSVAGNAVYAYASPATVETSLPPGWAAAAHMIPPVLLLLVTEVLATASTRFTGRGRAWALSGVVVIAVAAFALSFDALYEVARMAKVRTELAWLVPVMLDVAIIVCTTLVLMASRQIQCARAAAAGGGSTSAGPVADRPTTGVVAESAVVVDPVADRPVAVVADQPVAVEPPRVEQVAGSEPPMADTSASAINSVVDRPVVDDPVEVVDPVADQVVDVVDPPADPVADSVVIDHATVHPEVVDRPAASVADGDPEATDLADLAERVRRESGTTKPVESVMRVLELVRQGGFSQRAIAAEAGVDRTLVSRWIKAAEDVDRPKLTAVR